MINKYAPYLHWISIASALLIIGACFMPWTFHPDINETFTAFYSKQNRYGKPGKFIIFFSVVFIIFQLIPKVWAKRFNLFAMGLFFAFVIFKYFNFTGSYFGFQPQIKIGLIITILCSIIMMLSAIFPHLVLKNKD